MEGLGDNGLHPQSPNPSMHRQHTFPIVDRQNIFLSFKNFGKSDFVQKQFRQVGEPPFRQVGFRQLGLYSEEQMSIIVTKLGDKFIAGQNEQAELLKEVTATKNISTELMEKCTKSDYSDPISLSPTVFHHARVGLLAAIGNRAGRSGTSTDDSDDGGLQSPAGVRGSQSTGKQAWGSSGTAAKDIIPNDDDFSTVISKRQERTLSDQMKPSHPGKDLPSLLYCSVSAAGSSAAPVLADKVRPRKREKHLIGTANTSSMIIKAAKDIPPKAVFCVSNLNADTSCDEIRQFITSMNVRVLSCFVAKTRFVANLLRKHFEYV